MKLWLHWISVVSLSLGGAIGTGFLPVPSAIAQASEFNQVEIANASSIVLVAAPAGAFGHKLLILEQLQPSPLCWNESNGIVDPLLVNFDFTGICRRNNDSNGYSLRMAQYDWGLNYDLRVEQDGDRLVLVAANNRQFTAPKLEIASGPVGLTSGFVKLSLNPTWRLTRRAYDGQVLGHFYITNDIDLNTYVAAVRQDPNFGLPTPMEPLPSEPGLEPVEPGLEPVEPTLPPAPPAIDPAPESADPPNGVTPQDTPVPLISVPTESEDAPIQVPTPPPASEPSDSGEWIEFNREPESSSSTPQPTPSTLSTPNAPSVLPTLDE